MTSYLAPHECFNTTFMRTWNHDTRAVCIFMFLQRKKQTNHKSTLTLKLKRGLTCKEKYTTIILKTRDFFSQCLYQLCSNTTAIAQTSIYAFKRCVDKLSQNQVFLFSTQSKLLCIPFYYFYLEQWSSNKTQVLFPSKAHKNEHF